MEFRPFKLGYFAQGGATVVKMFGRGSDGKRHRIDVTGTEPYFYAPAGFVESAREVHRIDRNAGQCWKTEAPLDRIVTRFPFDVPKIRDSLSCKTWEADIVYEKRIRYDYGIKSGLEVPEGASALTAAELKACQASHIAPRWVSLDIETYDRDGFHGAEDARAPVVSVALWDSFTQRYVVIFNGELSGEDRRKAADMFRRACRTCGDLDCEKHDGCGWNAQVIEVATEEMLFSTLASWFRQVGPDIVVGWNIVDFDIGYLKNRCIREGMESVPWDEYCIFDAQRGYEFSTYDSLESTGLHYIAVHHFGLPGKTTDKRIWQMMERGRDELIFYNATDVFMVAEIVKRHGLLDFYLRLAERAGCGLDDTFSTGSMVDSMVFHHLAKTGRFQPTNVKREGEDEKIKGAEVFDPSDGLWFNAFASDNKSEYPMIMRTFNISPETIISDEQAKTIPHLTVASGNHYRTDRKGVYAELVEIIDKDRDVCRATGDKVGDGVNKKLGNTFFGFAPSKYNRNGDKLVGADITGMAREHLNWNKQFTENWKHPAKTLYGDSVAGIMPLVLRNKKTGHVDVREIQAIENVWQDFEVLSDNGFTPILRFIKKPMKKRMFGVRTMQGFVFVTEDHSLVDDDGNEIGPVDSKGKFLKTVDLTKFKSGEIKSDLNFDKAWLLGAFCADGHCAINYSHTGHRSVGFAISKGIIPFLEKCQEIISREWGLPTNIHDYRESTGCQRLDLYGTVQGPQVAFVESFRRMCYNESARKKIPEEVLNGTPEVMNGFLHGFYAGDGDKTYSGNKLLTRSESKSPAFHQGIVLLQSILGDSFSCRFRTNKSPDGKRKLYYSQVAHRTSHRTLDQNIVKKVQELELDEEFVYDLETGNHHFACGVGNLVVHNTDSCYAVFLDAPAPEVVKERAVALVKELNASFPSFAAKFGQHDPAKVVLKVNLEQVYDAFLQAGTKKKYAALYETPKGSIERNGKKYEIKVRGFEARKSDAAQETKDIQQSTLELMLFGAQAAEVVKRVSSRVKAWRAGEPESWRLGIPQVVSKKQQILRAVEFSNSFMGTSFRKGDRPALFFGKVDGCPKTDVFVWEWRKPLPSSVTLDLEHTIDRVLLTPLENVLDLLNIRPSDCSNPVDNADEWA